MKDIGPNTKELIDSILGFIIVLFIFWVLLVR